MKLDKTEILRYLGAKEGSPVLDGMIARAEEEVAATARPRHTYRRVEAAVHENTVQLGGTMIQSRSLAQHLRGCREAFLFACTLGPGVDALIKRRTISDMPLVPVLQACSAAYIEAYADQAQLELEEYARERGLYLRPRYSPGYGDFPLHCQRFLFAALDIAKKLGVSLTENYLMIPFKSVTAVIGLTQDATQCHIHRCMACTAPNCPFRKETTA